MFSTWCWRTFIKKSEIWLYKPWYIIAFIQHNLTWLKPAFLLISLFLELLSKDEKDQQDHQPQTVSTETIYLLLHLVTPLVDVIAHGEKVPSSKNYTTVASILMSRHLPDLYAALLELAYAPTSAFQQQTQTSTIETASPTMLMTPGNMMQQVKKQIGLKREERDKCARMFMWLFDRSDLPRAMESLMALLGNSPLHPVPNWLRTICGRFLSRILLKPNGVAIVLEFTIGHVDQCKSK